MDLIDTIMMTKEDVVQSGVMLIRNSEWSNNFIKEWQSSSNGTVSDSDQECLNRIVESGKYESHFKLVTNKQFVIKHVHFFDKTNETIILHVPGSSSEDRLKFLTEYSK